MYERITAQDPMTGPMRIYPAVHYAMGGLWVDYNLMTTIPGLFALGEANFSDHGANRLGASGLMQGLADGYFIIPASLGHYLAGSETWPLDPDQPDFVRAETAAAQRTARLLAAGGKRTVADFHRELGLLMWEHCGMARNRAGLETAGRRIPELREEFWATVLVPGAAADLNQSLERAGRVADYLEFAELIVADALAREESCGCHFREDFQTEEREACRNDKNFAHVAVWEHRQDKVPLRHREELAFASIEPSRRSYK
jgi:succinate dehydrogenase / fumarate reductase flavoprotein subunit